MGNRHLEIRRLRVSASCIKLISAYLRHIKHTINLSISHADRDLLAKLKAVETLSGDVIYSRFYEALLEQLPIETIDAMHETDVTSYEWYHALLTHINQHKFEAA